LETLMPLAQATRLLQHELRPRPGTAPAELLTEGMTGQTVPLPPSVPLAASARLTGGGQLRQAARYLKRLAAGQESLPCMERDGDR
jgi:hypothetical protein